jgi:hypothetical protein
LLKVILPLCWIPMRRRDVDWLAVFTDPSTRLGRPASDIIVAPRIFFEDDACVRSQSYGA